MGPDRISVPLTYISEGAFDEDHPRYQPRPLAPRGECGMA